MIPQRQYWAKSRAASKVARSRATVSALAPERA
jgi:hypothetical protein